jgi:hypothetical protein
LPLVDVSSPICPTCGQPASLGLAAPTERWECRNEACPEFGQLLDPRTDLERRELPSSSPERAGDRD